MGLAISSSSLGIFLHIFYVFKHQLKYPVIFCGGLVQLIDYLILVYFFFGVGWGGGYRIMVKCSLIFP